MSETKQESPDVSNVPPVQEVQEDREDREEAPDKQEQQDDRQNTRVGTGAVILMRSSPKTSETSGISETLKDQGDQEDKPEAQESKEVHHGEVASVQSVVELDVSGILAYRKQLEQQAQQSQEAPEEEHKEPHVDSAEFVEPVESDTPVDSQEVDVSVSAHQEEAPKAQEAPKAEHADTGDDRILSKKKDLLVPVKPILSKIYKKLKAHVQHANIVISPKTIIPLLRTSMEIVETEALEGLTQREVVNEMILRMIESSGMSDDQKEVCREFVGYDILGDTIDLVVDATKGRVNVNQAKEFAHSTVSCCFAFWSKRKA